ncbi:MAG: NAD(+)/NADH kinase [Nitrososphaerota archaeon]|nr:NAD(+)/NADH kinase [Nitrososphaerota archaeon]MDG6926944.1 NAD(+)/NADH kinase [Nitrososphaerota archaeon]MDG6930504.1 NAD(+)/NADH kinase [Nitrososphaerota archaeon]MDG6932179.1 NAD(+)/NADH kinase [Nitrososphaerota archaeon]MDG6935551.1 NAD(+)/NADH kinase [Nitrososphaerota archaeon]
MKEKAAIAAKSSLSISELGPVLSMLTEEFDLLGVQQLPEVEVLENWNQIMKRGIDVAISIGGDGTLLGLARFLPQGVPIVGINMGGRGIIAEVERNEISQLLSSYRYGNYYIERRLRLRAELARNETFNVLNEFYFQRANFNVTPYFEISSVNGIKLQSRMDGIIISTPTGSTGYNMSNMGPVLIETLETFIINPVMAINYIPVAVIPPVELRISCSDYSYMIADGQIKYEIQPGESVRVFRGDDLRLIKIKKGNNQLLKMIK